jgi:hypothetical protein
MTATATSQQFASRSRFHASEWIEMESDDDSAQLRASYWLHELVCVLTTLPADNRREFERFAEQWRNETAHLSSPSAIAMNHAYQRIIGMGERAIPYILQELARQPDHWFWALNAITGAEPVPEQSRGRMSEMAAAWIAWGRHQGYRV